MLLFFVLFFGIGFILNMLLRMTWIMAIVFPVVAIFLIDKVRFIDYFTNSKEAFSSLGHELTGMALVDVLIVGSGFLGAIGAGFTMRILRKKGYQMF
ncbi:YuiB family protein [Bacillus massilinigeriensis]|uniref:YuiB family protein n=1 Tax=Bacillus massilionigeriensis TaxID=1805475 RepID=UPI00096AF102